MRYIRLIFIALFYTSSVFAQKVPAPLFRDPITDGAADPTVVWNRCENAWWILYTQRRANTDAADVAYCYGNAIGIAESKDNGKTWMYRGTLDLKVDRGHNTFWAPDIVYFKGKYHLFVAYIKGVYNNWGGAANIKHFTSKNLWDWKLEKSPKLTSERVIDPTLFRLDDGTWRMWYKDERHGSAVMMADSKDLFKWTTHDKPAIDGAQEGEKVFRFGGYYWMITDVWHGMQVYRSSNLNTWEKQGFILDKPSDRPDDKPSGAHGDVVVIGEKAYIFYFTHPGRVSHLDGTLDGNGNMPYPLRRSSLQVAPLTIENGILKCDRDNNFDFYLPAM
jgi:sucrose-6-phosphate hydrolase SacC (GH32 family)